MFYQFIQSQKKKKEGKFEKDDFTIANFKKYLDEQSKEKPGEYEDIKRSFTQMGLNNLDKEGNNKVYNFAKAFDGLNLFGKKYTEEINLIRSKDYVS